MIVAMEDVEIVDSLKHAMVQADESLYDPRKLFARRFRRRGSFAKCAFMVVTSTRAEPNRACLKRHSKMSAHFGDVVCRRNLIMHSPVSHHVHAQSIVWHMGEKIDRMWHGVERIHVLREGFPTPTDPFSECRAWDVFHALHQLDKFVSIGGANRSKANATAPHRTGGDSVNRRRCKLFIPTDLAIVMRMNIDKARCNHGPVCIDRFLRTFVAFPNVNDFAVFDTDVPRIAIFAAPVDERASNDL